MNFYQSIVQSFFSGSGNSLKSYLIKGSAGSLALKICNTCMGLVIGIILARSLNATGYGHYAYAMALIQIITIPTVMGLPQLIVREVAAYQIRKDYSRMRGLLIRANQFVLGLSLFLAAAAAIIVIGLSEHLDSDGWQTFLISLALLPLLGLKNLRMAALRGLRQVIIGQMPDMLIRPVIFILLLAAGFFLQPKGLTPQIAMIFQAVATGVAFIFGAVFLLHFLPAEVRQNEAIYKTREWLKSAFPFMLLGSMYLVNQWADIIMLGIFRPAAEVGIYQAVVQGATLVSFVLLAVNIAIAPVVSGLYAERNMKQLQKLVTISARAILVFTLPVVLILFLGGQWLLSFFFGAEFAAGAYALRILCIGQLVNAGMGSVGVILNMTGHERYAVTGVAVAAVANIFLNAILIPRFGLVGAATATSISISIWNLLLFWWVYKHVGIISIAFKRIDTNFS